MHKYFKNKKFQNRRSKEWINVYHGELTPQRRGRYKKHGCGDCGKAKCICCHYEKFVNPKARRIKLKKESQNEIERELNDSV